MHIYSSTIPMAACLHLKCFISLSNIQTTEFTVPTCASRYLTVLPSYLILYIISAIIYMYRLQISQQPNSNRKLVNRTWSVFEPPPLVPCFSDQTKPPLRSYSNCMESMAAPWLMMIWRTAELTPSSHGSPPRPPHGPTVIEFFPDEPLKFCWTQTRWDLHRKIRGI